LFNLSSKMWKEVRRLSTLGLQLFAITNLGNNAISGY
jgi:hypothetical protein